MKKASRLPKPKQPTEEIINLQRSISDRISVVLVEPKYQGNIGAVARLMQNFGLSRLIILNPPHLGDEAYIRAVHAGRILDDYTPISDLNEVRNYANYLVGTSSVPTSNFRKFTRIPMDPETLWSSLLPSGKKVAIIFGREDDGLRSTEIEACDFFTYIPASSEYPSYNLSHAVAILLYKMYEKIGFYPGVETVPATEENMDLIMGRLDSILRKTNYMTHKARNSSVMLRRILSRAHLTDTEFYKLMGILKSIDLSLPEKQEEDE